MYEFLAKWKAHLPNFHVQSNTYIWLHIWLYMYVGRVHTRYSCHFRIKRFLLSTLSWYMCENSNWAIYEWIQALNEVLSLSIGHIKTGVMLYNIVYTIHGNKHRFINIYADSINQTPKYTSQRCLLSTYVKWIRLQEAWLQT